MILLSEEQVETWLVKVPKGVPIYLIGIGGSGMTGLAHLLIDLGFKVFGSDITDNTEIRQLRNRGVVISQGHEPESLRMNRPELIVYSSAVRVDNQELTTANKLQIPIAQRAVFHSAVCTASLPHTHCADLFFIVRRITNQGQLFGWIPGTTGSVYFSPIIEW